MNILAIEDRPEFVAILKALLRSRHKLDDVATLEAGRSQLRREKYDVALVDLTLLDSDGPRTLAAVPRLSAEFPGTRFVVLTGDGNVSPHAEFAVVHKSSPKFPDNLLSALGIA